MKEGVWVCVCHFYKAIQFRGKAKTDDNSFSLPPPSSASLLTTSLSSSSSHSLISSLLFIHRLWCTATNWWFWEREVWGNQVYTKQSLAPLVIPAVVNLT